MPAKTEKSTAKVASGPKVFDVAKPGKLPPSATARPIIISNRPVLPDPMVAGSVKEESKETTSSDSKSPSLSKITIKPLTADEQAADTVTNVPAKDTAVTLKPAADEPAAKTGSKKTEAKAEITPEEPVADAKAEEPPVEEVAAVEAPAEAEKPSETGGGEAAAESAESTDDEAGNSTSAPAEETEESEQSGEETSSDQAAEATADKETAELEAAAKHKEEIQQLVDGKEYVLPINAVERHRSRIAALLGLVLIILLGLLLVNLLLEFGFIRLGGLKPVVTFFK